MLLRTHFIFATFLGLLFLYFGFGGWIFFLCVLFGSLLPDVDTQTSSFGKWVVFRPLQAGLAHRGMTHSLFFLFVVATGFLYFLPIGLWGFVLGYCSHLFLDIMTLKGIPLFWPISQRFGGILRTGGFIEQVLFVILLLACGILGVMLLLQIFL